MLFCVFILLLIIFLIFFFFFIFFFTFFHFREITLILKSLFLFSLSVSPASQPGYSRPVFAGQHGLGDGQLVGD